MVDHTLLAQTAAWEEIREILEDAMNYEAAILIFSSSESRQVSIITFKVFPLQAS